MENKGRAGAFLLVGAKVPATMKNFSGNPKKNYREAPGRNFVATFKDEELAERLLDEGWNVKQFNSSNDGEPPRHYIQVKVNFGNYPPEVWQVQNGKRKRLNEVTVDKLDSCIIKEADLLISPYTNPDTGKVSAYLRKGKFETIPDAFDEMMADIPLEDGEDDGDLPF